LSAPPGDGPFCRQSRRAVSLAFLSHWANNSEFHRGFFSQTLGSKYSLKSYKLNFKYWEVSQNQVLASKSFACFTGGTAPFYGNCIYGTPNQLRAYTAGRYLDRYVLARSWSIGWPCPKGLASSISVAWGKECRGFAVI
jgi:hypothetical protein